MKATSLLAFKNSRESAVVLINDLRREGQAAQGEDKTWTRQINEGEQRSEEIYDTDKSHRGQAKDMSCTDN